MRKPAIGMLAICVLKDYKLLYDMGINDGHQSGSDEHHSRK